MTAWTLHFGADHEIFVEFGGDAVGTGKGFGVGDVTVLGAIGDSTVSAGGGVELDDAAVEGGSGEDEEQLSQRKREQADADQDVG